MNAEYMSTCSSTEIKKIFKINERKTILNIIHTIQKYDINKLKHHTYL